MGLDIMDKYSYLHFAVGIIFYYWNIKLSTSIIIHILFEILENTPTGIYIIDKYIKLWPGGKKNKDSVTNSIGDTLFFVLGWLSASMLNNK